MSVRQYIFCPSSTTCIYSLQGVVGLVQGFWFLKYYKCWTVVESHLKYSTVAQHQGDVVARHSVWEWVPCKLQAATYLPTLSISEQGKHLMLQSQWLHAGGLAGPNQY